MKQKLVILLALVAVVCWSPVQAATGFEVDFSSTIGSGNTQLQGYGFFGPYANVDIDWIDANNANVRFSSLTDSGNSVIYLIGQDAYLNVNATTFSVGTVTGANAGSNFSQTHNPGAITDYTVNIGSFNVSTFGSFNLDINIFDGYTHAVDTLIFSLTNTSGSWATAADVLAFNADGYDAAAHIFPASNPANGNIDTYTGQTGFAAEAVPVPGAVLLLGAGLVRLAAYARRRREE
jgi:hypothetical protein